MYFYKNVIDYNIIGLTYSEYKLNVENFFEITEEEYKELGGVIQEKESSKYDSTTILINALLI